MPKIVSHKIVKIVIFLLTAFDALTAIGGGIALLIGLEDARFPLEWLSGSLFSDYKIPALILAVIVGGSSLLATVTIFRKDNFGIFAAMAAGFLMAGFIVGEFLILKQVPPGPTAIECFYFAVGLTIFALGAYLWKTEQAI